MSDDDAGDEIAQALEILSVTIGGLFLDHADLATSPPQGDGGYAELAETLRLAGADIVSLAQAMAVMARRFSGKA
ncbi:MAG: hypothetical protein JWQ97_3343 [Phenylobacterium sp.]|nr:hypothetical protein [Phenylobacterium sp.]